MKLYWKILLLALLPLLLALGLGFFRLELIVRFQRSGREAADELKMALLNSRFKAYREDRSRNAAVLAGANDAVRAVQNSDTGFLVPWGELFLDPLRYSLIFFTDGDGIVLARAHDPYRFGDDLSGHPAVAAALKGRRSVGLFELDGEPALLETRPVMLYGEIQVGTVGIGAPLTKELLAHFSEGTGLGIEVEIEGFPPISMEECCGNTERKSVALFPSVSEESLKFRRIEAVFTEDELGADLRYFQRNLVLTMLLLSVTLLSGLFLLLRRYLRPFSLLVEDVTLLSGNQEDFFELRKKLAHNYLDTSHEVSVIAHSLSRLMERIQETITLLEWTSRTDPLTRISNRLHLDSVLEQEMKASAKTGSPLSVLIFDLDHFKMVNDDFGHQAGDNVLRRTAEILKSLVPVGFVGRWGGEEFLAVLPGAGEEEATEFGERIREAVENEPFPIGRRVTISAGVTEMIPGDTPGSLVGRADKGLYEAKETGRNRVVLRKA